MAGAAELPAVIGGEHRTPSGDEFRVVAPFDHGRVLATSANSDQDDARRAVDAALAAAAGWRALDFDSRAAILLRAADLLAGPWRARMNAATMLGQAKTVQQAEIDSACELADFWRFNVHFARQVLAEQPMANSPGVWNRTDHRPLEGFVYAVTPFNFTAIAGNLPTAPALMGNVVVWKPSTTQQLAASLIMDLLREAGLPDGVINMLPGLRAGDLRGAARASRPGRASTSPAPPGFSSSCGRRWARTSPATGPTRGSSAKPAARTSSSRTRRRTSTCCASALVRGAFEYSGQKCSAASRAYVPESLWRSGCGTGSAAETEALTVGSVEDFGNFTSAVIDDRSFDRLSAALDRARATDRIEVLAGGSYDDAVGYFVRPTVLVGHRPARRDLPHRVLRPDPVACTSTRTRSSTRCSPRSTPRRRTR